MVNRTGWRDVNLSWLCLRAMARDTAREVWLRDSEGRKGEGRKEGRKEGRREGRGVNPGKRPVDGLAFVFLKGGLGFKLYRCPVIQEHDLTPMRVYIRGGWRAPLLLLGKSVIRWWQTEAMACTGERGRRRCRRHHSSVPKFGGVSTGCYGQQGVSDIPLKII